MTTYKRKSSEIEAIIWEGASANSFELVRSFVGEEKFLSCILFHPSTQELTLRTIEGPPSKVGVGDYIIRDIDGEIYPCKPDIFKKTYDKVDTEKKNSAPAEEIRINGLLTMLGITANHGLTEFEEVYAELKASLFKG